MDKIVHFYHSHTFSEFSSPKPPISKLFYERGIIYFKISFHVSYFYATIESIRENFARKLLKFEKD